MSRRYGTVNQTKRLILALPAADYDRLVNVAASQVREPEQQAQYIIRRALSRQGAIVNPKNQEALST